MTLPKLEETTNQRFFFCWRLKAPHLSNSTCLDSAKFVFPLNKQTMLNMQLVWCRIISSIFIFDYNSNKLWIKNEQESKRPCWTRFLWWSLDPCHSSWIAWKSPGSFATSTEWCATIRGISIGRPEQRCRIQIVWWILPCFAMLYHFTILCLFLPKNIRMDNGHLL